MPTRRPSIPSPNPHPSFATNYNFARSNTHTRTTSFNYAMQKELDYVCSTTSITMPLDTRAAFIRRVTSRFESNLDAGDCTQDAMAEAQGYAQKLLNEYGVSMRSSHDDDGRGYRTQEQAPRGRGESFGDTTSAKGFRYDFVTPNMSVSFDCSRSYSSGSSSSRPQYRTEERRPDPGRGEYFSTHSERKSEYPSGYGSSSSGPGYRTEEFRPRNTSSSSYHHSYPSTSSSSSPPPTSTNGTKPPVCLYTVLGIPRNATADDIRSAYRKLSLKYHPDRASEAGREAATAKMAEVNQANDVLEDEKKRRFYDRTGMIPGLLDRV